MSDASAPASSPLRTRPSTRAFGCRGSHYTTDHPPGSTRHGCGGAALADIGRGRRARLVLAGRSFRERVTACATIASFRIGRASVERFLCTLFDDAAIARGPCDERSTLESTRATLACRYGDLAVDPVAHSDQVATSGRSHRGIQDHVKRAATGGYVVDEGPLDTASGVSLVTTATLVSPRSTSTPR